jgi:hypothetical protein
MSYRTSPPAADEIRYPVGHFFNLDSGYLPSADSGMTTRDEKVGAGFTPADKGVLTY